MNEPVFSDRCSLPEASLSWDDWNLRCSFPEASELDTDWNCHMVMGWAKGKATCGLWQRVSALCQTDAERRFLHQYLAFVKDRVFPMLIPQPWMGIAQRRRPDFVLFVPLCYWNYRWYAVQLDKGHPPERAREDELRDAEIGESGYKVIRLKPETSGYLGEVRRLVEQVEIEMKQADSDPKGVAREVPVTVTEEEEVPF